MNIKELLFGSKLQDDQVKDVDTESYLGTRHQVFENGNIIAESDTRDIFSEKAIKIKELKELASDTILAKAPLFEQLNAINGKLTAEETTKINTIIDNVRTRYKNKKQAILDAMSLEELEAINLEN